MSEVILGSIISFFTYCGEMLQNAAKYCKNAQICCKWFICCREAFEMTLTRLDKMFGVLLGSINIVFN